MAAVMTLAFDAPNLATALDRAADEELDHLDFGVIGFDLDTVVRRYNRYESEAAGLSPPRVVGHRFFDTVAPCMNNYLVAQRFEDAAETRRALDVTIDYVLTLRMRPCRVRLRLLSTPALRLSYVLVDRA